MSGIPLDQVEEVNEPLDQSQTFEGTPNVIALADRAIELAMATEKDPIETLEEGELGDNTAVQQARPDRSALPSKIITEALDPAEVTDLEAVKADLWRGVEKTKDEQELQEFYIETGLLVEGDYSPAELRLTTNLMIAEQVFRDKLNAREDDTTGGRVWDWVDRYIFRMYPIGILEDSTLYGQRKSEDLLNAAVTMSPTEYKAFIEDFADEAETEGFFTRDNYFSLMDAADRATNRGYDATAKVNQALALIEALPLLGGLGRGARKGVLSNDALFKADSAVARVVATEGQEAAADAGAKALKAMPDDEAIKDSMGPSANSTRTAIVPPNSSRLTKILQDNNLTRQILHLDKSGAFGRIVDAESLGKMGEGIVKSLGKRTAISINDYRFVTDAVGNPRFEMDFGKVKTGEAYSRKVLSSAEKRAKDMTSRGMAAEVVPVDPQATKKGYVIRVTQQIDPSEAVDPLVEQATNYGFLRENFARLFGSNAALDDSVNNALANMGEAGESAVRGVARDLEKKLTGVSLEGRATIKDVFKKLRDGPDADVKEHYSTTEFVEEFKASHPKGLAPTQKEREAFEALVEFEDTAWLLKANAALNKYVKAGYYSIETPLGRFNGKRLKGQPEGEIKVYNSRTGMVEKVETIDDNVAVWELDFKTDDGYEFISNPSKVSVLDHSDVMGFNSGGRRVNPDARYFIVLDGKNRSRAFLTAFTEKQAILAKNQLRELQVQFLKIHKGASDAMSEAEFDDLVAKNNDWNPDVTDGEDFRAWVVESNFEDLFESPIRYKARDQEIVDPSRSSLVQGMDWDTYIKTQRNRHDETLMDFGGGEAWNHDPVNAILQDFSRAASHFTHRAYTHRSTAAWVKRASQRGSGVSLPTGRFPKNDWLNLMQHAEIDGRAGPSAHRLRHQRDVIRRRLKLKGPVEQRFAEFGQEASEFVFDTAGKKVNFSDPSNKLLAFGFQSAFGFFNVSQFFMQGIHSATIAAISPRHGFKGAASVLPLRAALHAPDEAAKKIAIKRLAKSMGESEQDMQELVDYMQTSGRTIIDGDQMELGTGPSYGVAGWEGESFMPSALRETMAKTTLNGSRLLDLGLIPFRSGERLSRMTGISTAFFEWKAKNPGKSALSDEARIWITNREQALTFNMTAAGRAKFQSGLMKVPTQWLSYSMRSMEAVFLGRDFTAMERARMAAVLMPFYGLTGMGLGSFAEKATEMFGVEDPAIYTAIKYGVLDWLIQEYTPVETALATRLAPMTAFTDLYKKIAVDGTPLQAALGPSGEIGGGALKAFYSAMTELVQGNTVSFTQDTLRVLRQPSGLDNIAKGVGILHNGVLRSKTGVTLPIEMKTSDALASFMGFSPMEVAEFYSRSNMMYVSGKKWRRFAKEIDKDYDTALSMFADDPETGKKMLDEINVKIALSPFSFTEKRRLRENLFRQSPDRIRQITDDLIKRDKLFSLGIAEQTIGGNQ